jgi:hypothetical protein
MGSGGMVTGLGGATIGTGGAASGSGGATVGGGGAGGGGACTTGAAHCACYPNQTCNTGLTCLASICTAAASGSGGAAGAGVGGATGSGGATGGPNLLKNGDFSKEKEYWDLTWQAGDLAAQMFTGGEYCVQNASSLEWLSFSLGNPPTPSDAVPLDATASYTLSFRAMAVYDLMPPSIMVKIGQVETPYAELYSTTDTILSSSYTTFTHKFSPSASDPTAGLVFNGTLYDYLSTVCFDDVSLVKN